MKINCLPIDVYRFRLGDCTNSGISSMFPELLVYCPDGNISFDSDYSIPVNFCMVEKRSLFGGIHMTIVPATVNESGQIVKRPGWWMYGGNIADASDSRFTALKGHYYPLKIHDRREK